LRIAHRDADHDGDGVLFLRIAHRDVARSSAKRPADPRSVCIAHRDFRDAGRAGPCAARRAEPPRLGVAAAWRSAV